MKALAATLLVFAALTACSAQPETVPSGTQASASEKNLVRNDRSSYKLDLDVGESATIPAGMWEPRDRLRCGGFDAGSFGSGGEKHFIVGNGEQAVMGDVLIAGDGSATVTCEISD